MEIDIFDEIQKMRHEGRKAALATIVQIRGSVPSFQSAKMLIRDDGSTLGSVGGGCVEAEVWTAAQDVIRDEKAKVMSFDLTDESMAESGPHLWGQARDFRGTHPAHSETGHLRSRAYRNPGLQDCNNCGLSNDDCGQPPRVRKCRAVSRS